MECVAYLRVSTEKQAEEGNGLDSQKRDIENYCRKNQIIKAINILNSVQNYFFYKLINVDSEVVEDNIITSMGPALAILLGVKLVEILVSKEKAEEVAEGLLLPQLKKFI